MADLGTLNGASPLNASDDVRLTFTADTTETQTSALDNTAFNFQSMDTLSWQVEYRLSGVWDTDVYDLDIRIMNGATVLAADDAGGTFVRVATDVRNNPTDTTSAVTAFAYVNTSASKTLWDGANIELQQTHTQVKGADGLAIEVDYVALTGTFSPKVVQVVLIT